MTLSLIIIAIIACSCAVGYIIGVDVGVARAKRAAIATYREMHGRRSNVADVSVVHNPPTVKQAPHGIDEYI